MYSQATVSAVLVVTDDWLTWLTGVATLFNRLHIQRLSLSASSVSGAPPGGEVIPEPLWMGQTYRTGGGSAVPRGRVHSERKGS